eukprot:TRINITY_DN5605_c1_g1_i1.p1 TRINITY_DN5605_c1_g1~~TRINITY_DN5605_c1_g1_i1.p1  ORF type:complete len:352 (+),score=85.71 TRINITY_DN5605_c1_g1_i1:164-1219(+)
MSTSPSRSIDSNFLSASSPSVNLPSLLTERSFRKSSLSNSSGSPPNLSPKREGSSPRITHTKDDSSLKTKPIPIRMVTSQISSPNLSLIERKRANTPPPPPPLPPNPTLLTKYNEVTLQNQELLQKLVETTEKLNAKEKECALLHSYQFDLISRNSRFNRDMEVLRSAHGEEIENMKVQKVKDTEQLNKRVSELERKLEEQIDELKRLRSIEKEFDSVVSLNRVLQSQITQEKKTAKELLDRAREKDADVELKLRQEFRQALLKAKREARLEVESEGYSYGKSPPHYEQAYDSLYEHPHFRNEMLDLANIGLSQFSPMSTKSKNTPLSSRPTSPITRSRSALSTRPPMHFG